MLEYDVTKLNVNRRHILLASTSLCVASVLSSAAPLQITRAQAQATQGGIETSITEQEAHAIAVDAYLYFKALESAREDALQLMAWKIPTLARVANGWSMNTDTMGVYGNYYLKRAIVTQVGLGANLPEDAIYPVNLADESGKPLDGANKYTLHFDKGDTPPANAFWSVTLYDAEGFQVANPLNRFNLASWMPLKYNADGSLDLYFQNENPNADKEANWLPAPKGAFNLLMRLYAPRSEALTGKWNPPPVTHASLPGLGGQ